MAVQQHVLNWLYSVLTSEYHDVNRTYNDVAQALSVYSSLSPRTDVHTFDNGVSALLLHLSGTIPILFRGTTYRFPISIWVPHPYPREAPLAYVTPTENMAVRPGQHVDPQGRIYHPYLAAWPEFWDKSSLLDFLAILRDIFAKEPPVVSKVPKQQFSLVEHTRSPQSPPPVPPLPADVSRGQTPLQHHTPQPPSQPGEGSRPPPPPPKGDEFPQVVSGPSAAVIGPPVPPLPPGVPHRSPQYSPHQHLQSTPSPSHQSNRSSRYDAAPPLPPQQAQPYQHQQHQQHSFPHHTQAHPHQMYSQGGPPAPPPQGFPPVDSRRPSVASSGTPYTAGSIAGPPPPGPPGPPMPPGPPQFTINSGPPPHPQWQQPPFQPQPPQQQFPPQPQPQQPAVQPKPPPPPDIMDEPLTLSLPSPSNLPPPPIPPNPEKDALLRQLASTLYTLRQQARAQNESSLAGLAAQRAAMQAARQNLQGDMGALPGLSALLSSNAQALRQAIGDADRVINGDDATRREPPAIDDLLVAPTVVGNQLYDVAAEERALGDAIFVLGRAVERGRLNPAVFARTTRSLAREWYLKKALVRKIGRGMGLVG